MLPVLALQMPGPGEWIVIAVIGLLLFGKRLPEVGRSLARTIVDFKKELKNMDSDVDAAAQAPPQASPYATSPATPQPAAFKFDPQTGKPVEPAYRFDPHTGKPIEPAASQAPSGPGNPA